MEERQTERVFFLILENVICDSGGRNRRGRQTSLTERELTHGEEQEKKIGSRTRGVNAAACDKVVVRAVS